MYHNYELEIKKTSIKNQFTKLHVIILKTINKRVDHYIRKF